MDVFGRSVSRIATLGVLVIIALGLSGCEEGVTTTTTRTVTTTTTRTVTTTTTITAFITFGNGEAQIWESYSDMISNSSMPTEVHFTGFAAFVVDIPGIGVVAYLEQWDRPNDEILILYEGGTSKSIQTSNPYNFPYGNILAVCEGKVYVRTNSDIISVIDPTTAELVENQLVSMPFPGMRMGQFFMLQWNGKQETFAPVKNETTSGIRRFDPSSRSFGPIILEVYFGVVLRVIQQSEDVLFATYTYAPFYKEGLVRLERNDDTFKVVANMTLPGFIQDDVFTEIIMGLTTDTFFATSWRGSSTLQYYTYTNGAFTSVNTWDLGDHFAKILYVEPTSGDVVIGLVSKSALMVLRGLGKNPTVAQDDLDIDEIPSVRNVLSFLARGGTSIAAADDVHRFYW